MQYASVTAPAPIPLGVADYFWQEAYNRRALEASLLALFRTWGYGDVITPLFEYADTIAARSTTEIQAGMMRFVDRDGSTLALRSDMTIGVARLVGTRLHDWPMPQRFCYAGNVYRHAETQAGQQREFHQVGVELIGAADPRADAEVLILTSRGLELAGLSQARLAVGHMGYFHGLLAELHLSRELRERLLGAIDRNSQAELHAFLAEAPLTPAQRHTLSELPYLSGDDAPAILAHAERLCLNDAMTAALENLAAILSAQAQLGASERVYLDLTEIHDLGYYTGITFEALTPQVGFPVASGGRYDQLVGSFGYDQPAVGVAFSLDRILLARRQKGAGCPELKPSRVRLVVSTRNDLRCLTIIDAWRRLDVSVELDVLERDRAALYDYARRARLNYALDWQGDGFLVYDAMNAEDRRPVFVTADDAPAWIFNISSQRKKTTS